MEPDPVDQLMELCQELGATTGNISKRAKFLKDLQATKHAQEVLSDNSPTPWSFAARKLLVCVVGVGGDANFDEYASLFVTTYFNLKLTPQFYTPRMHDLSTNYPHFKFPTSPKTWNKLGREYMTHLVDTLHSISEYSCGSDDVIQHIAQEICERLEFDIGNSTKDLSDEHKAIVTELLLEKLPNLIDAFARSDPFAPVSYRFQVVVTAIVTKTYARAYAALSAMDRSTLLSPTQARDMLVLHSLNMSPVLPEVRRTVRFVAQLIQLIEERDAWDEVLLANAAAGGEFEVPGDVYLRPTQETDE